MNGHVNPQKKKPSHEAAINPSGAKAMQMKPAAKKQREPSVGASSDSSAMSEEHRKIEVLALSSELSSAKAEIKSLQGRNREL